MKRARRTRISPESTRQARLRAVGPGARADDGSAPDARGAAPATEDTPAAPAPSGTAARGRVIPLHPLPPPGAQQDATQFFRNYTQREPRVPAAVWWTARGLALGLALLVPLLLWRQPQTGLLLFWGVIIPLVPALLVIAPGLWRQVCPMATLNQLPRLLGRSRGAELPEHWKDAAFGISLLLLIGGIALRRPLLNSHAGALAALVLAMLAAALIGGLRWRGRSGWCGTFCPLGPVQRLYGQAPLVVVRNGYCTPCVGCQKSCYDFNPRAAVFSDLYDADPRNAAQRRLFMGFLPGLVLGYFLAPAGAHAPVWLQMLAPVGGGCATAGLYLAAQTFVPALAAQPFRVALAFGVTALGAYYAFAGPLLVDALATLTGHEAPPLLRSLARGSGLALAAVLAASGLHAERRWREAREQARPAQAEPATLSVRPAQALREGLARQQHDGATVTDRETGISFTVAPDATLLDGLQAAGLKINYGCRSGLCGADAVAICAGHEHLAPPGADECATLRRLGLDGHARLACMTEVRGPVLIDRDVRALAEPPVAPPPQDPLTLRAAGADGDTVVPPHDPALDRGVARVVIVGNGVAGMTVAEQLRRMSPGVQITLVAHETHGFYNRMAIARLLHEPDTDPQSLALLPGDWAERQRITLLDGTVAARIDRPNRLLLLARPDDAGTPQPEGVLEWDRLVLASGASGVAPDARFLGHANAFVLRGADDALAMRRYAQRRAARRALVLGGGVLGIEAAEALCRAGLQVTLVQRADRLMNEQLDRPGAQRVQTWLEMQGVQVLTGTEVTRFEGTPQRIESAWLSHGPRVQADLYVAALGIRANTFLAEQCGLAMGRHGVLVDEHMQTTDPQILAVGDVADLPGTARGLWPIATAQAHCAVATLIGLPQDYSSPRHVLQLKSEGIAVCSNGETAGRPGDETWTAGDNAADGAWWRLVLRQGQLVGGLYVGPPGSAKLFVRLLQRPIDLTPLRPTLREGRLDGLAERLAAA
ncbi:MAG: hypothetical protein RIQ53_4359 [Pseudomonadota bacterium]